MLNLTRPLVVLDLETTGVDLARDRITEVAAVKLTPRPGETSYTQTEFATLVNPGRAVPDEVQTLTGITNEMLVGKPTFRQIAPELLAFLQGCDLGGFGVLGFDLPLLWEEFFRAGLTLDLEGVQVLDAGNVFKKKHERTLAAAVKFYLLREHEGAHRAAADADAATAVLLRQAELYPELREAGAMAEYSAFGRRLDLAGHVVLNDAGVPVYNLGKAKGVALAVDPGFGRWMLRQEFPEHTKQVLRRLLPGPAQQNLLPEGPAQ